MNFIKGLTKTAAQVNKKTEDKPAKKSYGKRRALAVGASAAAGALLGNEAHLRGTRRLFKRIYDVRPSKKLMPIYNKLQIPTQVVGALGAGYLAHRLTKKKPIEKEQINSSHPE